jgi:hypothetical protein
VKVASSQKRSIQALLSAVGAIVLIYLAARLLAADGEGFRGGRRSFGIWELAVISQGFVAALLIAYVYRLMSVVEPFVILPDGISHPGWRRPISFQDIERVDLKRDASPYTGQRMQVALLLRTGMVQLLPHRMLPCAPTTFAKQLRAAIAASRPPLS